MDIETDCNPQFYVNVADIEQLQSLDYYIACTTEKIFQSKTQLYDVFVDNQNVTSHLHSLEPLLKLTRADTERFDHLNNIRWVGTPRSYCIYCLFCVLTYISVWAAAYELLGVGG